MLTAILVAATTLSGPLAPCLVADDDQLVIAVAVVQDPELGQYAILYDMNGEVSPVLVDSGDEHFPLNRTGFTMATIQTGPDDLLRWPVDPICEFKVNPKYETHVYVYQMDIELDFGAHPRFIDVWSPRGRNGLTSYREVLERHLETDPDLEIRWVRRGILRY